MSRASLAGIFVVVIVGCQTPAERAASVQPLPQEVQPRPYGDLWRRARLYATGAVDALYDDKWALLEDNAKGLEQTARYLEKASEVPPNLKASLPTAAGDLAREATALLKAAQSKDVKGTNEILTRVHLKVRDLRSD